MKIDIEDCYNKYAPMVFRRCFAMLRDEDDALDAAQDVFVNLLRYRKRLHGQFPSSLLYTIATNICLNRLRRRKLQWKSEDSQVGTAAAHDPEFEKVEDGIPIGFLSIVRKGGYHAIEYSFSEFFTYNVTIKSGIEKFYNNLIFAYNQKDEFKWDSFSLGLGFGSILPIGKLFFFNPELNFYSQFQSKTDNKSWNFNYSTLLSAFGIKLGKHFSISAGPSLTWVNAYKINRKNSSDIDDMNLNNTDVEIMPKPLFSLFSNDINKNNRIVIGARAAVRLVF